jgi:hypothetical protein
VTGAHECASVWPIGVHVCAYGMNRHVMRMWACLWDKQACMCARLWVKTTRLGGKDEGCKNLSFLEILMCLWLRWLIEYWIMWMQVIILDDVDSLERERLVTPQGGRDQ